MRKSLFTIVTSAFFLFLTTSAYNPSTADARIGYRAPYLGVGNVSMASHNGKYVLVTFWSTSNPDSRISNRLYDRACRGNGNIRHISVNLDRSSGVGDMACRLDSLDPAGQFHCDSAQRQQVVRDWSLDRGGYQSFLLDSHGKIVAIDPAVQTLRKV